jgi:hypothetical protein
VIIGVYSFEMHIPESRSLKDRRHVVRRVKDRIRSRHNVAVAEDGEHAELWQRAGIFVVSIASHRESLDETFESILRDAEAQVPGHVTETGREFIDLYDAGPDDWRAEEA